VLEKLVSEKVMTFFNKNPLNIVAYLKSKCYNVASTMAC